MSFDEKLLDGKYLYFKDGAQYSEEVFKVTKESKSQGNYTFSSEILSRVATGEFLKVYVDYELSHQFEPLNVRIKRSLGERKSTERYVFDTKERIVHYSFDGADGHNEMVKVVPAKAHIATPAFLTSTLMTQIKRIDSTQVTQYAIITSQNLWSYESPFSEGQVYVDLKSLDSVELELNGNKISATHCTMFEGEKNEFETDFFLSKYFNIPYQAKFPNDIEIRVDKLKTYEVEYKNMFK